MYTHQATTTHHAPPEHMTGAELQTLREACHLTRDDLADLCQVQARTIKHWENGRSGVPADVSALVLGIDQWIDRAAVQLCAQMTRTNANVHAVWVRYREPQDRRKIKHEDGALDRVPEGAHAAAAHRAARACQAPAPRVVWFDAEDFDMWRARHKKPATQASVSEWASLAIHHQAKPHKADQPTT